MKKKEEKYFMAGTDDELQFGDMIELDFTREKNGSVTHHHLECKFIPELVDFLLDEEIIEVKGGEKREKCIKLESTEEAIEYLLNVVSELSERLIDMEEAVAELLDNQEE